MPTKTPPKASKKAAPNPDASMRRIDEKYGSALRGHAAELGIDPALAAAVLKVESGGTAFHNVGGVQKATIRFENHVFWKNYTKDGKDKDRQKKFDAHFRFDADKRWEGHAWRSSDSGSWTPCHKDQPGEYAEFEYAKGLDADAAYKSISVGMGQILGEGFALAGKTSAKDLYESFDSGEDAQIGGTFEFIKNKAGGKALKALKAGDFPTFVAYYNGSKKGSAKNADYTQKLRDAADAYRRVAADPVKPQEPPHPAPKDAPHKPAPPPPKDRPFGHGHAVQKHAEQHAAKFHKIGWDGGSGDHGPLERMGVHRRLSLANFDEPHHAALPDPRQSGFSKGARKVSTGLTVAGVGLAGVKIGLQHAGGFGTAVSALGLAGGVLGLLNFATKIADGTLNDPLAEQTILKHADRLGALGAWLEQHDGAVKKAAVASNWMGAAAGGLSVAAGAMALTGVGLPVAAVLGGIATGLTIGSVLLNPAGVVGVGLKVYDGLKFMGHWAMRGAKAAGHGVAVGAHKAVEIGGKAAHFAKETAQKGWSMAKAGASWIGHKAAQAWGGAKKAAGFAADKGRAAFHWLLANRGWLAASANGLANDAGAVEGLLATGGLALAGIGLIPGFQAALPAAAFMEVAAGFVGAAALGFRAMNVGLTVLGRVDGSVSEDEAYDSVGRMATEALIDLATHGVGRLFRGAIGKYAKKSAKAPLEFAGDVAGAAAGKALDVDYEGKEAAKGYPSEGFLQPLLDRGQNLLESGLNRIAKDPLVAQFFPTAALGAKALVAAIGAGRAVNKLVGKIPHAIGQAAKAVVHGGIAAGKAVGHHAVAAAHFAKDKAKGAWGWLKGKASQGWDLTKHAAHGAADFAKHTAQNVGHLAHDTAHAAWDWTKHAAHATADMAKDKAHSAWDWAKGLAQKTGHAIGSAGHAAQVWAKKAVESGVEGAQHLLHAAHDVAHHAKDATVHGVQSAAAFAKDKAEGAWGWLKGKAHAAADGAVDLAGHGLALGFKGAGAAARAIGHLSGPKVVGGIKDGGLTGVYPQTGEPADPHATDAHRHSAIAGGATIFVNGVANSLADHEMSARRLAKEMVKPVVGVFNTSDVQASGDDKKKTRSGLGTVLGYLGDLFQSVDDTTSVDSPNPAIATMTDLIVRYGDHKKPPKGDLNVVAHSQGSIILSKALWRASKDHDISKVDATTMGNATFYFPKGANYHHYVFDDDLVANKLGTNSGAEKFFNDSRLGKAVSKHTAKGITGRDNPEVDDAVAHTTILHQGGSGIRPHAMAGGWDLDDKGGLTHLKDDKGKPTTDGQRDYVSSMKEFGALEKAQAGKPKARQTERGQIGVGNAMRKMGAGLLNSLGHGMQSIGLEKAGGFVAKGGARAEAQAHLVDAKLFAKSGQKVQRRSADAGPEPHAGGVVADVLGAGEGHRTVDANLASRLGKGFEPGARLHSGPAAAQAARSLGADAFTVGSDVVFGAGHFDPHSERGMGLLAHELTHVQQQTGDDARFYTPSGGDAMERQAQAAERSFARRGAGLSVGSVQLEIDEASGGHSNRLSDLTTLAIEAAGDELGEAPGEIESLSLDLSLDVERMSNEEIVDALRREIVKAIRAASSERSTGLAAPTQLSGGEAPLQLVSDVNVGGGWADAQFVSKFNNQLKLKNYNKDIQDFPGIAWFNDLQELQKGFYEDDHEGIGVWQNQWVNLNAVMPILYGEEHSIVRDDFIRALDIRRLVRERNAETSLAPGLSAALPANRPFQSTREYKGNRPDNDIGYALENIWVRAGVLFASDGLKWARQMDYYLKPGADEAIPVLTKAKDINSVLDRIGELSPSSVPATDDNLVKRRKLLEDVLRKRTMLMQTVFADILQGSALGDGKDEAADDKSRKKAHKAIFLSNRFYGLKDAVKALKDIEPSIRALGEDTFQALANPQEKAQDQTNAQSVADPNNPSEREALDLWSHRREVAMMGNLSRALAQSPTPTLITIGGDHVRNKQAELQQLIDSAKGPRGNKGTLHLGDLSGLAALGTKAFSNPPSQAPAQNQQPIVPKRGNAPNGVEAPEHRGGLPDALRSGIESLSGFAMDGVNVHYNSAQPSQVGALAYAQGTDIHLAPGQERHLPHEAWHVVQQMQGRVQPTMQAKGPTAINDDTGLEAEADRMGARAMGRSDASPGRLSAMPAPRSAMQRVEDLDRRYAGASGFDQGYIDDYKRIQALLSDKKRMIPILRELDKEAKALGSLDEALKAEEAEGGWSTIKPTLIGQTPAAPFEAMIRQGELFDDALDPSHGAYMHRIQWYAISRHNRTVRSEVDDQGRAETWLSRTPLHLFKESVNDRFKKGGSNMWDFVVDLTGTRAKDEYDFTSPEALKSYLTRDKDSLGFFQKRGAKKIDQVAAEEVAYPHSVVSLRAEWAANKPVGFVPTSHSDRATGTPNGKVYTGFNSSWVDGLDGSRTQVFDDQSEPTIVYPAPILAKRGHPGASGGAAATGGMPDNLRSGIESLSGHSMDDVQVHYNSAQPAGMGALAYAQGTDIHLAPGQERHLPHEAWHVVQQMQGRVRPTMQMKGAGINDDAGLEAEADAMGARAAMASASASHLVTRKPANVIQRRLPALGAEAFTQSSDLVRDLLIGHVKNMDPGEKMHFVMNWLGFDQSPIKPQEVVRDFESRATEHAAHYESELLKSIAKASPEELSNIHARLAWFTKHPKKSESTLDKPDVEAPTAEEDTSILKAADGVAANIDTKVVGKPAVMTKMFGPEYDAKRVDGVFQAISALIKGQVKARKSSFVKLTDMDHNNWVRAAGMAGGSGEISISPLVFPKLLSGSPEGQSLMVHEMSHVVDKRIVDLSYNDSELEKLQTPSRQKNAESYGQAYAEAVFGSGKGAWDPSKVAKPITKESTGQDKFKSLLEYSKAYVNGTWNLVDNVYNVVKIAHNSKQPLQDADRYTAWAIQPHAVNPKEPDLMRAFIEDRARAIKTARMSSILKENKAAVVESEDPFVNNRNHTVAAFASILRVDAKRAAAFLDEFDSLDASVSKSVGKKTSNEGKVEK